MKKFVLAIYAICLSIWTTAQNPIVQTCFTTDPAPMVCGDRLYVFTGHDEEGADFFWMNEWRLFSTSDMVNWTDEGCPLAQCDMAWADDRAWAPQCIGRNGKYYLYVPVHSKISGGMAIGVAVADKITGPYKDALGKPLYEDGKWDHIDPTVWIDGDGQAYLYWGNPKLYSVRLNEDMISLSSEVKCDDMNVQKKSDTQEVKRYTEGPWIMHQKSFAEATKDYKIHDSKYNSRSIKKNSVWGKYFMVYAAGGVPECIAYSTSDNPQGPWTYEGEIMPQTNFTNSFTNHSGIVEFKGHNYFFYHTGWLPRGGGFGRSVCVEEFKWNADGTMPEITPTKEGVKPIATFNPYTHNEAETMAFSHGLHTDWNKKQGRIWVSDIHNGDWQKIREVDFGETTPKEITVSAASALQGGNMEVHIDSVKGEKIAEVMIRPTGGWEEWEPFSAPLQKAVTGRHDIYFVYKGLKGCRLFNCDWWEMKR